MGGVCYLWAKETSRAHLYPLLYFSLRKKARLRNQFPPSTDGSQRKIISQQNYKVIFDPDARLRRGGWKKEFVVPQPFLSQTYLDMAQNFGSVVSPPPPPPFPQANNTQPNLSRPPACLPPPPPPRKTGTQTLWACFLPV